MKSLNVYFHGISNLPKLVGQLYLNQRKIYFEYDSNWLATGFSLSPYSLQLSPQVQLDTSGLWQGLHGVFNDSLPDGWGLLLMDRALRNANIDPKKITPLDRLAWLGDGTMGALSYQPATHPRQDPLLIEIPQLAENAQTIYAGKSEAVLPELFRAGGSPGGARPKALIAIKGQEIITADGNIPDDFTSWLVKFNAKDDFPDAGNIEYAYSLMAKDAGIEMPATQLLENKYFAVQRFDRSNNQRVHVHTLGNMIAADFRTPSLDYTDSLKVVQDVTKSRLEVIKLFRQMVFNIIFHNRDDHSKNFSFIWNEEGNCWRLSPAYDLMFTSGIHGEHSTTIAGEGKAPTWEHIFKLSTKFNLEKEAKAIAERVNNIAEQWESYACKAGVLEESEKLIGGYIKPIRFPA